VAVAVVLMRLDQMLHQVLAVLVEMELHHQLQELR
jgi:hypothetical protein